MILVDDRTGSKDLAPELQALGFQVEVLRMEFGDIAWTGRGEKGTNVQVGLELKKLPDLLTSLRDNRLGNHQIPGMLKKPDGAYDYGWLIVEGKWRKGPLGEVQAPKYAGAKEWKDVPGSWKVAEMRKRLWTLEMTWGVHVEFCQDRTATLDFLSNLYHWWTDVALDEHKSQLAEHNPMSWLKISDFREVVRRFPEIGLKASLGVEQYFGGSLRAAVNADVKDWAAVPVPLAGGKVKRLGHIVAERVVKFCRGEK
jgi:ERCC4-type nuclease